MGGTDAEMAADPIFQEVVLPYLIADGRMFHRYEMAAEPLLTCPVTTIVGDRGRGRGPPPVERAEHGARAGGRRSREPLLPHRRPAVRPAAPDPGRPAARLPLTSATPAAHRPVAQSWPKGS